MIGAFLYHGESYSAIHYFNSMLLEGSTADPCTFVSVLTACSREKSLNNGKRIHIFAMALGLDLNPRVGTSLLEMYRRCGILDDVQNMFNRIEDRDAFSWSVIISAYVEHGLTMTVVPMFQQMLQENSLPDSVIFASTLASCIGPAQLKEGKRQHALFIGSCIQLDHFLITALINMYGRCGDSSYACILFKELPKRDVITWNSMISMHAKKGLSNEAIQMYAQMLLEDVKPDEATFVSLLDACSGPEFLSKGIKLHDELKQRGFESNILVSTTLLNMYSRCGNLQQAWDVFNNMTSHDIVSWNVMINAFAQHQHGAEALELFESMQLDGVTPDKVTYLNVLQACTSDAQLSHGNQIHNLIVVDNLESNVVIATALVTMYGKCRGLWDAWKLFTMIPEKTLVSWNAMIAECVQAGCLDRATFLFEQMQLEGEFPNEVTFASLLSLHETGLTLRNGRRLHSCLQNFLLENDVLVANALISMYGKCGSVDDAMKIFRGLEGKNVVTWTIVMSICKQNNWYTSCSSLFKEMQQKGVVPDKLSFEIMIDAVSESEVFSEAHLLHIYAAIEDLDSNIDVANSLIHMYGKLCSLEDALSIFYKLDTWNKQSFINVLNPCANLLAIPEGLMIHSSMVSDDIALDKFLGNNLINLYGKCGHVDNARWVFDKLDERDTFSWSIMINTYAQHGQGEVAMEFFDQMCQNKIIPNEVTFIGVLTACNHAGLVDVGLCHLISMEQEYGITPLENHYNCIVDLLSRSGRLEEAENMVLKIPQDSRGVAWMTLLGACVSRGDVERGQRAAKNVFELDPENPVPYIILHNTFTMADAGVMQ
ncbi:hypothetical protein KP509_02G010800 [Ceratopteris richardii]|nr:hypothetical protein KP509_02G010800 [Ceratopteris richardii]